MTPNRINRLRTYTLRVLVGDGGLSLLLWSGYLADIADGHELTLLGGASTTAVLAGMAGLAAIILTGQAAIIAATRSAGAKAVYYRGYGDCAADRLPDPPEID